MAATLTSDGELTYFSFPIEKTEDAGGEVNPVDRTPDIVVYGKATDGSLDGDLQVVDPEWSAKALQEWMETGGNLRVQHQAQRDPAGVGLAVDGHYVKGLVVEPAAKHLVRTKALRDFSIGISHPKIDRDPTGKAMNGVITGHPDGRTKVCEVSLVDRGSNHNSRFQLVKAAGDGTPQYVGKMLGTSLGDLAGQSVTIDMPADVSVAFSPGDLAKLLAHRAEAERRQAEADAGKDWASWDAAHGGSGAGAAASTAPASAPAPGPKPATGKPLAMKPAPAKKPAGKKPDSGNSTADASAAWQHAHQTLQEEHEGKKPDAADRENAHLIHEAHEAHLAHEAHERAQAAKKAVDPDVGGGTDRDEIPGEDFAGKHRSFPIVTPQDVHDAAQSIGQAGDGNHPPQRLKKNIKRIARRKGPQFEARLPQAWKDEDAAKKARKAAAMTDAKAADPRDCETCDGSGKILEGHRDCPDCHGGGKKGTSKDAEPGEVKTGQRSCKGCGKNHHSDSPAKFCDGCGTKLPGGAKEEDPDLTKKGGQDQEPPGDDDEDDEDQGSDLDGDDEDDGDDDQDDDDSPSKSSRPAPGDGVTGEHTQPVPPHREPDGKDIEALEHDARMPTVPDGDLPKAAWLRLKALGVPHDAGALHDLLCPAYDPVIAAKCHPWQPLTSIDTATWRDKAMDAAASAPLDVAGRMQELWQHAETIKATDPVALAEVSDALHKAFSDANPGPGSFPTPAELDPRRFRRPYIDAGHAANSPQASGPNTATLPASGGITATDYHRDYLSAGRAADSPQNKASGDDMPPAPGASNGGRTFYRNTARDNAKAAMQAMHDHIASTFPDLCPMKDDPHADPAPKPGPLPVPVRKADKAAKAGDRARELLDAVIGGDMTIDAARAELGLAPAALPGHEEAPLGKAAGAAAPDLVKAALAEATAPLAAQLAEALQLIGAQGKAIKKLAKTADAIAAQPDPIAPYRGAPLEQPGITKTQAPAGPLGMAGAAEQSQQLVYAELHRTWRESPDPTERLAAERAMSALRGLPGQ